jgi:hypothetical protein
MGCVVNATLRPLYPRETPGTHCIGGWMGLRAGLDVCRKSRPTGIRSPDRPARSESLYRLRYSCPHVVFMLFHLVYADTVAEFLLSQFSKANPLTNCGPVTQICVFCVFTLKLWKTDDAKLPFNTRLVFTHLITQYMESFLIWSSGPDF